MTRAKSSGLGTLVLLVFVSFCPPIANAGTMGPGGLVIDMPSLTIPEGGTGAADVMIHSTGSVDLSQYSVEFAITPTGSTTNELDFAYNEANQATLLSSPNYVFGANGGTSDSSNVGTVGIPATTYTASDSSNAGGVIVPATDVLLSHLDFTTLTGTPPVAGDTYALSAVFRESPSFRGATGAPITFTENAGIVAISEGSSAGVPEPSSLLLLAGGLVLGWHRTRRSRIESEG